MFLSKLQYIKPYIKKCFEKHGRGLHDTAIRLQTVKQLEVNSNNDTSTSSDSLTTKNDDVYSTVPRVVPMVLRNKEPIVLPFDDIPGPKSLKYLSIFRNYISEIGTQFTASFLTFGLNIGTLLSRKPIRLSKLFDEYGPVVRFVSPVGNDIVLINHPEHIQKVFSMEGEYPVRSTLESLERYRIEHKNHAFSGLYSVHGQEWVRQRSIMHNTLQSAVTQNAQNVFNICDNFAQKVYTARNYQDEMSKDLYKELHKWAFDCMGFIVFAKDFKMLDTEQVCSQWDSSWMYHSLEKATEAIIKCETGLHLWKFVTTPAWYTLVKYCDNLDSLIGKYVLESEQDMAFKAQDNENIMPTPNSLTSAILLSEEKFKTEDIATILMDMLLIGVNTITTSMSFLLYNIALHQKCQRLLYQEIENLYADMEIKDIDNLMKNTPFLQACIKETLRLVPPIPLLTRILSRNITLDGYNIPRGTLIILSTRDTSLKEGNFDQASNFYPQRWLKEDCKEYHTFATIPFGFGARKCVGQNVAEIMLSLLTIRVLQKYRLEYHYGDIQPTRNFIVKPNKPLKIRFIDRI